MAFPVQEFQIGQRVRPHGEKPFVIYFIRRQDGRTAYSMLHRPWYFASALTLCPERPPYVPSERLVLGRTPYPIASSIAELYRCETDDELAARHAVERAEYDVMDVDKRQVCDYPICSKRCAGHPLACKCRTATPKVAP